MFGLLIWFNRWFAYFAPPSPASLRATYSRYLISDISWFTLNPVTLL